MTASGARMDDAMGAAGDEEGGKLRRGIDDGSRSMLEQEVGESIWLRGCEGRVWK